MEKGYLYFNEHLKPVATRVGGPAVRKKNKLVESPHPEPELTLSAAPGLDMGHVDKLIALATKPSTHPSLAHLSLADLARLRLEKRANPTYSSLEEFFYIRSSCHLIEEIQGDFYCDCRDGIKGHI